MYNGGRSTTGVTDLDVDEMVKLMSYKLNSYLSLDDSYMRANKSCKIHRVQEQIRKVDPSAYQPILLSIGPYHHGLSSLLAFEREKWNCLDYFLKLNRERKLEDYLKLVGDLEEEARTCYSDDIDMEQDKFLQMLLLDGCFILQYFSVLDGMVPSPSDTKPCSNENSSREGTTKGSPRIDMESLPQSNNQIGNWYHSCVGHDLVLLENQIPFFIVRSIYEMFAGNQGTLSLLTDNIAQSVESFIQYHPKAIQEAHRPSDFHHILHLLQLYIKSSEKFAQDEQFLKGKRHFYSLANLGRRYLKIRSYFTDSDNKMSPTPLDYLQHHHTLIQCHRAVQYHQAGVQFKKKFFDRNNPHSLLDISFGNGVLEIPSLFVDQSTISQFRNIIALEQTCPHFGNDVTAYSAFMSFLLCTPDDVAFLARKGIIVHQLRSDGDVSASFSKLGKNVDFDLNGSYFLKPVCLAMEEHYKSRLNRWMAWLWQNHFRNPWLSLTVIAAALMLFCTIVQTMLALLSYLKPVRGIS